MAEITLPFAYDMQDAVEQGRKVCTSRGEKKGEVGDTFEMRGRKYRIVEIDCFTLDTIADCLYRHEGFESPDEFRARWRTLHRGHYSADKYYFVHYFAAVFVEPPEEVS